VRRGEGTRLAFVYRDNAKGTESLLTLRWREMDSNFQYAGTIKLIVAPLRSPRALHRVRKWAGWTIGRRAVESLVVSDNGRYR